MSSQRPKRAYQFTIEVGADTPKDMALALRQIAEDIADNINCGTVSGGVSSGWSITPDHAPGKTHDDWEAELKAYLDAKEGT